MKKEKTTPKYKKFQKAGNARYMEFPYQKLHTLLKKNAKARGIVVDLTYEQYRHIAEHNPRCHYCHKKLKWTKHGNKATAINLDRKSHKSSYNVRNVVASCARCNYARGRNFTYKQWVKMTTMFRSNT